MTRLKRLGRSLIPADAEAESDLSAIPSGQIIEVKITKSRSHPHHRYFFALIKAAFDNWPELADEQFDSEEHLRKWLLARSGHADKEAIEFDGAATDEQKRILSTALETAFRAERRKGVYVWVRPLPKKAGIAIIRPRSIAFDKMDEGEFTTLSRIIVGLVEEYTGISSDDLCPDSQSAQWAQSLKNLPR
jgi:hypothetical protein